MLKIIIQHHIQDHINKINLIIQQQFGLRQNHSATVAPANHRVHSHRKKQKSNSAHTSESKQSLRFSMAQSFSNQTTRYPSSYKFIKYHKKLSNQQEILHIYKWNQIHLQGNSSWGTTRIYLRTPTFHVLHKWPTIPTQLYSPMTLQSDASSWSPTQAQTYFQNHIDLLQNYFTDWKLKINSTKTQAITFTSKRNLSLSKLPTKIFLRPTPSNTSESF